MDSELQRKSEDLISLEAELKNKQKLLEEREQRVNELEELLINRSFTSFSDAVGYAHREDS